MLCLSIAALPMLHERVPGGQVASLYCIAAYPSISLFGSAVLFPFNEDVTHSMNAKLAALIVVLSVCCAFDYGASITAVVGQPLCVRGAVWWRAVTEMSVLISVAIIIKTSALPVWTAARMTFALIGSIYLACCICVSGICGQPAQLPGAASSVVEAVVMWCCWLGPALAVNHTNRIMLSRLCGLHVLEVPLNHLNEARLSPTEFDSSGLPPEIVGRLVLDALLKQDVEEDASCSVSDACKPWSDRSGLLNKAMSWTTSSLVSSTRSGPDYTPEEAKAFLDTLMQVLPSTAAVPAASQVWEPDDVLDSKSDSSLFATYGDDEEQQPLMAYSAARATAEWRHDAERRAAERAAAGAGITLRRPHRSPTPLRPTST